MTVNDQYDPEKYDAVRIPTAAWTLAHEAVTFRLPESWLLTERMFSHAVYDIAGIDGGDVRFEIGSFEDAAAVESGDLGGFLELPGGKILDSAEQESVRGPDGAIDWTILTVRDEGERVDRETGHSLADVVIWRRIGVLPPAYIRTLTVTLSLPAEQEDGSGGPQSVKRDVVDLLIHKLVNSASFSEAVTSLDRIAATPDLEAVWFDDIAAIRLPRGWKRKEERFEDGNLPLYSFDSPGNDEWTFWVQLFSVSGGYRNANSATDLVNNLIDSFVEGAQAHGELADKARFLDPEDPSIGYSRTMSFETDDKDNERLRRTSWYVVKVGADMMVVALVHWVVVERLVREPHIRALGDVLEREVPNMLILPDLAAAIIE